MAKLDWIWLDLPMVGLRSALCLVIFVFTFHCKIKIKKTIQNKYIS